MGLFKRDFNKPGPGVPKNAPRKRGFARFIELVGRDFGNLVKLNLLYCLCVLPAQLLLGLSILFIGTVWFVPLLVLAIAACIPLGPAKTAMTYIVSKMLRDDPGFIWHDFKKQFKANFKSTLLPGIVYGALTGTQAYAVVMVLGMGSGSAITVALFLLSVLIFSMVVPYYFLQAAYLDLGPGALLKNSVLLTLGYLPRSFMGMLLGGGLVLLHTLANVLLFGIALPVTLVLGYTFPCLLSLMWIWPQVDKTFNIEKTLRGREDEAEIDDEEGETDENEKANDAD